MSRLKMLGALLVGAVVLAGCNGDGYPKHLKPIPAEIRLRMEAKGMTAQDPILVRIFKEERELEVWKYSRSENKYTHLKSWDICAFSGELGPKLKEGDRQSPEGFYAINPGLMNPKSSYHLAFNTGFPNEFDRSHGRTGSHLMVHGDCSSRGCYAMTNEGIEEIYALAREAFNGGQKVFWVHAFPFRMTEENMEKHPVELSVNGERHRLEIPHRKTLADAIREDCGLTGTHVGCEHGVCGACTVLVDGRPVRSCLMLAHQAEGTSIRTVESLASGDRLHPLQQAFIDNHAIQCGFCTPGFLMLVIGAYENDPDIAEEDLTEILSSNLCRCTGYQNIGKAVRSVMDELRKHAAEPA